MHLISDLRKASLYLLHRREEFFPSKTSIHLKELYGVMAMLNFAFTAIVLYEPIYLFTLGYPLWQIMLYYAGIYGIYFFLMPLGGKFIKCKGFEHGIMLASLFQVANLMALILIPVHGLFLIAAIVALALQKTFFWPGYHADFAYFGQSGERGREVGTIVAIESIMSIAGPLVGGIITTLFGFAALFGFICVVIMLSNVPFFLSKETFTPTTLSYAESYRYLVSKGQQRYFWGYVGFGEELIVVTVWPIFLFMTFGTTLSTGAAVALSTLITVIIVLYVGRFTDRNDRKFVERIGAAFIALSWWMRLLARGAGSVIMLDLFSRISKQIFIIPISAGIYEYAAHSSVVKNVIFVEMSLTVGKFFTALVLAAIFAAYGNQWMAAFVFGAMLSLLLLLIGVRRKEDTV